MQQYKCLICGYIYDPAAGDPDDGVEPGRGLPLRICRTTGSARSAAPVKTNLNQSKTKILDGENIFVRV